MNPLPCCPRFPAPPAGIRIPARVGQAGTQSCTVAWDPVPGANMYQLEKKNPDGTYALWYEGSATQYTKTGLFCGASPAPFTVRVRAGNEAGWGPWTPDTVLQATQICVTAPPAPGAPYRVSASCVGTGKCNITIGWSPVSGATSYKLYHTSGELKGTTSGTQLTLYNQPCGTSTVWTAQFYVVACNEAGCSGPGSAGTISFPVCPPPVPSAPGAPYRVSASCVGTGKCNITIGWSPVSGATSYKLYHTSGELKGTTSGTQLTLYNQPCGTSTVWTAQFYVVACNEAGCSGPGAKGTISFPVCP